MYSCWTQHIKDDKDKEIFRSRIASSKAVLHRLDQIIEEQEKDLTDSSTSLKSFDNPNWALRKAYIQGYLSRGKSIRNLIDLDNVEVRSST